MKMIIRQFPDMMFALLTENSPMKLEEINNVLLQIGDTEDAFLLYLCAHLVSYISLASVR
jgi:hypothetical protein